MTTLGHVRIATWNVNSVRPRVPRLLAWLDEREPDVVCLQETKQTGQGFADLLDAELADRGFQYASHGQGQWNGVALLSRVGLIDVEQGFAGQPDFAGRSEARAISATCGGVRVYSLYVPNGREVDSEHYRYKLAWLAALREQVGDASGDLVLAGDINIAPADIDVFDPAAFAGHTHVTPAERSALAAFGSLGLVDVVREHWPDEQFFSYWDYRAGMFHQNLGMRIDLVLTSPAVTGRCRAAWIDRRARKGKLPSDHAPVVVDLDSAPDGDIGPMVPPPSAPRRPSGTIRLPQNR